MVLGEFVSCELVNQSTSQPVHQSTSLSNKMKTHKDLKVWNEAIEFVT